MKSASVLCVIAAAALAASCAQDNPARPDTTSAPAASTAARIGDVPDSHGGRPLSTHMTGGAERPGPADPDGSGDATLTLNHGQGQVCFELTVHNIVLPATGAHIHKAPPTAPGPIVVPLQAPGANGTSRGCVDANQDLIKDIIQNPEDYYVNVHNAQFPAGAIRGQLSK